MLFPPEPIAPSEVSVASALIYVDVFAELVAYSTPPLILVPPGPCSFVFDLPGYLGWPLELGLLL